MEMERAKRDNIQIQYRLNIEKERKKFRRFSQIETSKLIAVYLFTLLNAIVIFSMVAMWTFADLSYLGVLITDIAAQIVVYAIYCAKAYKAKKSEEELKFEREKYATLNNGTPEHDNINLESSGGFSKGGSNDFVG